MKGSRAPALLVALAASFTLAACGVPPSDVIQAGEPASGMLSSTSLPPVLISVPLYFLHNGHLRPYTRRIVEPGDFQSVVRMLFGGPTASEAVTATTDLPRLKDIVDVTVGSDNTLSVRLPADVSPLSPVAMQQLACTVAHVTPSITALPADARQGGASASPPAGARRSPAPGSVRVFGDGWTKTKAADSCPGRPQS